MVIAFIVGWAFAALLPPQAVLGIFRKPRAA
jgi:hypothetical protein